MTPGHNRNAFGMRRDVALQLDIYLLLSTNIIIESDTTIGQRPVCLTPLFPPNSARRASKEA